MTVKKRVIGKVIMIIALIIMIVILVSVGDLHTAHMYLDMTGLCPHQTAQLLGISRMGRA